MQNELSRADQRKLKDILAKKQAGRPLTYEEDQFAKSVFNTMVDSKTALFKTVRFLTGEQIRKGDLGEKPVRREEQPRQVDRVESEDADPKPDVLETKLPDADNANDTDLTEEERLADITQRNVAPSRGDTTGVKKSVKVGDIVVKSFGHTRKIVFKGQVIATDQRGVAMVKWADGRVTGEVAATLTKANDLEEVKTKTEAEQKDEKEQVTPPIVKTGKWTHTNIYNAIKDKPGVTDPHALAQWIVEQHGGESKKKVFKADGSIYPSILSEAKKRCKKVSRIKKDGDIFGEDPAMPHAAEGHHTPFEDLTDTLHDLIHLARTVKSRKDRTNDEEITVHYEEVVEELRAIAESILAGLSTELEEAEYSEEG